MTSSPADPLAGPAALATPARSLESLEGLEHAPAAVWTCPFCPLLCDDRPAADPGCARALDGLRASAAADASLAALQPRIDGQPVSLDAALAAAADRLAASRQPLFGGWGVDVAGARALYPLAAATGAISDAAAGEALSQALRALQDRGGYTTTMAEVASRADLIVFVGSWAPQRAPRLLSRWLRGDRAVPALVALGAGDEAPASVEVIGEGGTAQTMPVAAIPLGGGGALDLPDALAALNRLLAAAPSGDLAAAHPALADLAERLRAATYAVLVWEPARIAADLSNGGGGHAGLLIERLQQLIGRLNLKGRAAGFPIGGADGAATAMQVHGWLSGLPLRTRVGPRGLEHDPLRLAAPALLAAGAVDLLLWTSAFGAGPLPPTPATPAGLPRIVLGVPALADALGAAPDTIFIPVATPGVHTGGHLFRADGVVLLPLHPADAARAAVDLPSAAAVLRRLLALTVARQAASWNATTPEAA